jgi:hypothetical protein
MFHNVFYIEVEIEVKVEVEALALVLTLALVSSLNSFAVPQLQLWQTVAKRFKISNNGECKNNS